jgi:hypothetical protein
MKTYTKTRKELVGRLHSLTKIMNMFEADRVRFQPAYDAAAMELARLEVEHHNAKAGKLERWFAKFAQRRAQEAAQRVFVAPEGFHTGRCSETRLIAAQEAGK